ncbi:hypothetical protein B0H16DRAFT_1461172 [Mycena metata]|uniref:Mitochondrial splicing suppressor 51-like C-terminal domain-containing protein n=1 Tax=Mycena metata TaxID=1033252 RepID=A0AAD7N7X0_9AGAR|nr:hypothetical protein B0H16DRAFT_1461172 [Mycena metata]
MGAGYTGCKMPKENDKIATNELAAVFSGPSADDTKSADRLALEYTAKVAELCEKMLGRPLARPELEFLRAQPKCTICARSDLILHGDVETPRKTLVLCSDYKLAFHCSDEHAESARLLHQAPSEELLGGLSQCQRNRQYVADVTSLKELNWEAAIGGNVEAVILGTKFAGQGAACLRHVSSLGSTAMSILYVLEQLSTNTTWTAKSELILHFIGNLDDAFERPGYMYEAILHRLLNLKMLSLFFFSPTHFPGTSMAWETKVCGDCRINGAKIVNHFCVRTYEGFIQNKAELFMNPDLCIASKSLTFIRHLPDQWRRTIQLLISRGIPTVEFLQECAATLVQDLTMVKNPFADLLTIPDAGTVTRFEAHNAWFVGAFQ